MEQVYIATNLVPRLHLRKLDYQLRLQCAIVAPLHFRKCVSLVQALQLRPLHAGSNFGKSIEHTRMASQLLQDRHPRAVVEPVNVPPSHRLQHHHSFAFALGLSSLSRLLPTFGSPSRVLSARPLLAFGCLASSMCPRRCCPLLLGATRTFIRGSSSSSSSSFGSRDIHSLYCGTIICGCSNCRFLR